MANDSSKERKWGIPVPFRGERVSTEGGWGTLSWAKNILMKVKAGKRSSYPERIEALRELCCDCVKSARKGHNGTRLDEADFLEMKTAYWVEQMLLLRSGEYREFLTRTACQDSATADLINTLIQENDAPLVSVLPVIKIIEEYRDVLVGFITDFEQLDKL